MTQGMIERGSENEFHQERAEERLPVPDRGACVGADAANPDDHHPRRPVPDETR